MQHGRKLRTEILQNVRLQEKSDLVFAHILAITPIYRCAPLMSLKHNLNSHKSFAMKVRWTKMPTKLTEHDLALDLHPSAKIETSICNCTYCRA